MANMLRTGMDWLRGQLQTAASETVVYRRGALEVTVLATIGRKLLRTQDGAGQTRIEVTDADFVIEAALLVLEGQPIEPQRGDQITLTLPDTVSTFEVAPYGDEPPYRWSDPFRLLYRVHGKLIAVEPVVPPLPAFAVLGLSLSAHWLSGNVFVRLIGTGFTGATAVHFGSIPAQWFHVVSDTQINCSPAPVLTAQSVTVSVTTPAGTTAALAANQFTFTARTVAGTPQTKRVLGGGAASVRVALADRTYQTWTDGNYGTTWITNDQVTAPDVGILLLTANTSAPGVCLGPGGNCWLAGTRPPGTVFSAFTWKVTPAGVVTQYSLPAAPGHAHALATDICTGSAGDLWAVGRSFPSDFSVLVPMLWQIQDAGTVTALPLFNSPLTDPSAICAGADSAEVWIAGTGSLLRIQASTGAILSSYSLDFTSYYGLALGPDRKIWLAGFVSSSGMGAVMRFDPATGSGAVVTFPGESQCGQICAGPDGALWTVGFAGNLYRINPTTLTVATIALPGTTGTPANGGGPNGVSVRKNGKLCVSIYVYPGGGVDGFILDIT